MRKATVLLGLVLLVFTGASYGNPVYLTGVADTDWSGSRSAAAEIIATGGWANDFQIEWAITRSDSIFHYQYDISGTGGDPLSKGLSHFILEVSGNCAGLNECVYNAVPGIASGDPQTYSDQTGGDSNPGLVVPLFGVKFAATGNTATITFDSLRAPMWGNFFAKDGVENPDHITVYAYNAGLINAASMHTADFIPVPDTKRWEVTPEPQSLAMGAIGVLCLAAGSLYRRKRLSPPR